MSGYDVPEGMVKAAELELDELLLVESIRFGVIRAVDTESEKMEASGYGLSISAHGQDMKSRLYTFVLDGDDISSFIHDVINVAGVKEEDE